MAETKKAPGPRGGWLLGSTLDFKDSPLEFCAYVQKAYGDVARFQVGPSYWYLVSHPEDIHSIMTEQASIFQKPKIAKRLWSKFLGDGILTTEAEVWRRQNRMMRPAFHKNRIEEYGRLMVEYTHRMIDGWTDGSVVDMDDAMVGVTLEIVAKTLFDADVQDGAETVGHAMHVLHQEMIEHIHMPLPVPKWWPSKRNKRKLQAIKDIEDIVHGVISERRDSGKDHGDLLSMLMAAEDEEGQGLSDTELRDQSMTIFFAGHETTAHAMTWTWYLLAKHPEITTRLVTDIHEVTGGDRLSVAHLSQLPYLEMVIKESMRILPSVWVFIKEPTQDAELRGYKIPKGAQVVISPYVIQHDERWYKNPETFDPERFSKERVGEIPNGAYVPFSGGARICLGKSFAMMEAQLIIGSMVQRLVPRLAGTGHVKRHAQLSMHPLGGLPATIMLRSDQKHAANT
jgi:cytochrome P450